MSTIERVGQHFLAFTADGLRTIVRIGSIQVAAECDPTGSEVYVTAGNRDFRVTASLQEIQAALEEDWRSSLFRRAGA